MLFEDLSKESIGVKNCKPIYLEVISSKVKSRMSCPSESDVLLYKHAENHYNRLPRFW